MQFIFIAVQFFWRWCEQTNCNETVQIWVLYNNLITQLKWIANLEVSGFEDARRGVIKEPFNSMMP